MALTLRYGLIEYSEQMVYRDVGALLTEEKVNNLMANCQEKVLKEYLTPMQDLFTYLSESLSAFKMLPPILTNLVPGSAPGYPLHRRTDLIGEAVFDKEHVPWYFISAQNAWDNDMPFSICLPDPVTVNHLLQSNVSSSIFDVTRTLLTWGVRFHTFRPLENLRLLWALPPIPMFFNQVPLGLGLVEHGYRFTLANYEAYVAKRDNVIHSLQGCAALQRGDLLWRLACDPFGDDSEVYRSPSAYQTHNSH
ncbi:hypothetical protein BC835DRAFT_1422797 [Cytidiella melzeri]|nr:hypothetical protein BC835DRAFT_1422797 [Cytidiella melzeri]